MAYLYTISQIRAIERQAVQDGISEYQLMQRAGEAALRILLQHYRPIKSLDIVCGKGNNGGDGYVLAHLASQRGIQVNVYELATLTDLPPTAQTAAKVCHASVSNQIKFLPYTDSIIFNGDIIIDAILGIGAKAYLEDSPLSCVIQAINQAGKPIIALDLPSGLNADQGSIFGDTVCADLTITFIGVKRGMLTGLAPNYCGKIVCDTLGLTVPPSPDASQLSVPLLHQRKPADHKGLFGHVLVIGGDLGMGGAVCLSAEAALRSGAGLVTALTRPEHVSALLARCPEVMCYGIAEKKPLPVLISSLLKKITACVIGPGMGSSTWSKALFDYCLKNIQVPMVLDAGALDYLVQNQQTGCPHWVLTPHPGEAARLLNLTTQEIQHARFAHIRALQKKFNATIVLKGAGTLICEAQDTPIIVSPFHHSAMATAGMGDVLSGIIGSLLAQGYGTSQAATAGVWIHSRAGKLAYEAISQTHSCQTLLAHELFPYIPNN